MIECGRETAMWYGGGGASRSIAGGVPMTGGGRISIRATGGGVTGSSLIALVLQRDTVQPASRYNITTNTVQVTSTSSPVPWWSK